MPRPLEARPFAAKLGLFSAMTPPWPAACFPPNTKLVGRPKSPACDTTQSATDCGTPMNCVNTVSSETASHAAECAATDALPCADRLATKHSCAAAGPAIAATARTVPVATSDILRPLFIPDLLVLSC